MSKKLIITEKPSVAMDFARVLKVNGERRNGFLENDEYVISWCYGHLVQMVYPEEYDIKYKKWALEDLPFLPKDYKYGVIESSKEQYAVVNRLLHRDDVDTVYWAGDSGKEGQVIEENIRMYGGVREGMNELRVWIDSQTDEEMQRGIREAKPMSDYALLGKSGIMRSIEDYALGINFSRALSVKYGRLINDAAATSSYTAIALGRVMTCVLGMVVNREREIRNFNQDPFFKINGHFADMGFPAEWKAVEGTKYFNSPLLYGDANNGFKTRENAEKFIEELAGKPAEIKDKDVSISKKRAPLLFNLAELQAECSKRFKISPAQALDVAQSLYEKKLTTYPRTDARVLTTAVAKEISKNLYGLKKYEPTAAFVDEIISNKRFLGLDKTFYTDDKKVTDHYAIIPTGQTGGVDNLNSLEKSVYEMIVRRFLSIFYPAAEYKNAKLQVGVEEENFFASTKILIEPGYLKVAGIPKQAEQNEEGEDADESFSKEKFIAFVEGALVGDKLSVGEYTIKEGQTAPPKRYTSGSLILAMENAGKLIEEEELREQIKTTGIGTSATRGEILEKLVRIKYLNQNPKNQIITPERLGEMIYEVVALTTPSLLSPKMTASWEKGLEGITEGTVNDVEYRAKLEDYIRNETNKMVQLDLMDQIVANINQFTGKDSKGAATRKPLGLKCPQCGGELTTTSFGYGCSNYRDDAIKCKFSVGQIAGVDIPEEQFRKLITEGQTDLIEGFKSKNGSSRFAALLKLEKNEAGEFTTNFDFTGVKSESIEGLNCPVCGAGMVKTSYGFACEKRFAEENKCSFAIGEIAGRKLSEEEAKTLINTGATEVLTGFKSKNKTPFNAKLKLQKKEDGSAEISFDFEGVEAEKLEGFTCPDCGGDLLVRSFGYTCANFVKDDPSSCHFAINKTIANKNLSASNIKQLLKEGKTDTIRGFKSKAGKKFDACLIMKKNDEGKTEIVFDFENAEPLAVDGVVCPDCGGKILVKQWGYGCSNYVKDNPESCGFAIGKIAGKSLTAANVKQLLTDGKTETIRDFKSKAGKKFDACLILKKNDEGKSEISFDFENVEAKVIEGVKCPICGGNIVKTSFGFGCSNYNREDKENSCKFNVGQIAGVTLKEAQVKELLEKGITQTITGFKSAKGTKFDAKLTIGRDEEGKVTGIKFVFESDEQEMTDIACPKCGAPIIKNRFGFRCKNDVQSEDKTCDFHLSKVAGLQIPEEQFVKLIKEKQTDLMSGFLSQKGVFFDARLKLEEDGKVSFAFDSNNNDSKN